MFNTSNDFRVASETIAYIAMKASAECKQFFTAAQLRTHAIIDMARHRLLDVQEIKSELKELETMKESQPTAWE